MVVLNVSLSSASIKNFLTTPCKSLRSVFELEWFWRPSFLWEVLGGFGTRTPKIWEMLSCVLLSPAGTRSASTAVVIPPALLWVSLLLGLPYWRTSQGLVPSPSRGHLLTCPAGLELHQPVVLLGKFEEGDLSSGWVGRCSQCQGTGHDEQKVGWV